ncbi:MAG TPA: glutamate--tRNA ligase [Casimicrobiaceae bacterium]|nr:glutamate--tRNA ligase [Casimicrobiaceae bacterium]
MVEKSIRTRFAPSPTGFIHLGNIRSALFPWAFARHHGGVFILRVEDTDTERSTPEAVSAILESMEWLGLDYDEGPYFQMQRADRYRAVLDDMLARGLAYRCYTTPAELDELRAAQMSRGEKPRYDGRWRPEHALNLAPPPGVAPVIRFKNPLGGVVAWDDAVKGRIEIENAELDDLVIARADGTPTYNFCVVVDDLDMNITHVIRGDDHVNNTPRQINIIRALGAEPPVYAHLPTVLTPEGDKLSKRHGAKSVLQYRDEGYLPDAIVNYLARLGWSHGDAEIFSRDELVEWFDLAGLSSSPARFDPDKLKWVNHEHIKRLSDEELGGRLLPYLQRIGIDASAGPGLAGVAALLRDRAPTLADMAEGARLFYQTPKVPAALLADHLTAANRPVLAELNTLFADLEWTREAIGTALRASAARHGLKPPQVMMALRVLVTGSTHTPAIDAVLALLGRECSRERIAAGLHLG